MWRYFVALLWSIVGQSPTPELYSVVPSRDYYAREQEQQEIKSLRQLGTVT